MSKTAPNPKKAKTEGVSTRSLGHNWFLGVLLSELPTNQLPTTLEVLSYYQFKRESTYSKEASLNRDQKLELMNLVVNHVVAIWLKASIFTIRKSEDLRRKLDREVAKLEYIFKHCKWHEGDEKWIAEKKKESFSSFDWLFDIAQCKCLTKIKMRCKYTEKKELTPENLQQKDCKCAAVEKIPEQEWEFYLDQRHERKLFIELGKTDFEGTLKLQKDLSKAEKFANEEKRIENQKKREYSSSTLVDPDQLSDAEFGGAPLGEDGDDGDSDSDFEERIVSKQKKWNYPNTTSFAMRHGLSTFIIMGMINCVLRDLDVVDQTKFVSRKKVRNMKEKWGNQLVEEHTKNIEHKSIAFDGKKNHNLQKHCQTNLQENISVITEPGGHYLHHFTPNGTKGKDIGRVLYDVVLEYQSQDTLLSVGADGCPANTSPKVGAIRYLELQLERCVNWVIW